MAKAQLAARLAGRLRISKVKATRSIGEVTGGIRLPQNRN